MRTAKDKDAILGTALVRALQKECATAHPEVEELSALIDGKLSPDERTSIMGHLASCDRCYELFSMSSEMVKEQQEVRKTARFNMPFTACRMLLAKVQGLNPIAQYKMPLALAAVLLLAIGLFFTYKGLDFSSPEVVALKVEHQKEAPRLSAPAELKGAPASSIASVQEKKREETKPKENSRGGKLPPVFYAEVAVNDAVGEFLSNTPDEVVTDKNKIGELVAMLVKDDRTIGGYDISEVRIEHGETIMRSAHSSAQKAEIRIKNRVLTIRVVD